MTAINNSAVIKIKASTTSTKIFKVVVLPPFLPECPALWFCQVDAIFATAGIVHDIDKFKHVVSQLPQKYAIEVKHIIICQPGTEKYETLKAALIEQRARDLLYEEELGDRKPSEFLAHLRSIAGRSHEILLKTVFFRRLPSQVQDILSGHTDLPLEKMASLADKILDATSGANNEATPNRSPSPSSAASDDKGNIDLQDVSRRLNFIMRHVALLTSKFLQNSKPSSGRGRPRRRHGWETCWYHRRWGNMAKKCILPCAWGPSNKTFGRRK